MTEDVLTATDYEVPGPGQHRVKIEEVKKRDGKYGPYYRIATKVVGGDYAGLWVSFVASAKLTPAAKLRIAIEDILDRKLKKGEKFNPQELVGREAIAEVSNTTEDERTFANIDQFFPLREGVTIETTSYEKPENYEGGAYLSEEIRVAPARAEIKATEVGSRVEGEEEPLPDWD